MTDEPEIHEGEHILTPAMRKQFADSFAYAKARYGSRSAAYKEAGGYANGGFYPRHDSDEPEAVDPL